MKGHADVIVGLQYGDEGKAKWIDLLAENYDIIARFQGGANAGHTIEVGGKRIALNQVPSGIFHPDKTLYIGSGCVVDPVLLLKELKRIADMGIDLEGRLHISDLASVVMPHHKILDAVIGGGIGTTGMGIGPVHEDKARRIDNYRICDLFNSDTQERIIATANRYNARFASLGSEKRIFPDELDEVMHALEKLKGYIEPNHLFMVEMLESGKNVLFEGAQAVWLSVDKGTVPYVTSSYTTPGFAPVGGDVPLSYFRNSFGVAKAIMSRVGNGPFVSEFGGEKSEAYCAEDGGHKYTRDVEAKMHPNPSELVKSGNPLEVGIGLRILGNEYGATTGRPRRIGALDLILLRETCRLHGICEGDGGIYLSKVDCLEVFGEEIPVVTGYKLDGQKIDSVPSSTEALRRVEPVITNVQTQDVHDIVNFIQEFTQTKIRAIGTGPDREAYTLCDL